MRNPIQICCVASALMLLASSVMAYDGKGWSLSKAERCESSVMQVPSKQQRAPRPVSKSADESPSIVWGWCGEPQLNTNGGPPVGSWCISLIGLTDNITTQFDGCQIRSILVARGEFAEEHPVINLLMYKGIEVEDDWGDATIQVTDTIFRLQDLPFDGETWDWVEFELPEPVHIIAGESLYAGWEYKVLPGNSSYYMVMDDILNEEPNSSWMSGLWINQEDPTDQRPYSIWSNCWDVGANCIRLRIEGDNLPTDNAIVSQLQLPRYTKPNTPFDASFTVYNAASSTIESLEISYGFTGAEPLTMTLSDLSVAPGEKMEVTASNISSQVEGNLDFYMNITKVNGKNDSDPSNNVLEGRMLCLENGFERNVVVEEATGTWCGNCPRGIVGMDKMREAYPERFIGIAAHEGDPMAIDEYTSYMNAYIPGFPYSTVNRIQLVDPTFSLLEAAYLNEIDVPAIADVKIDDICFYGKMIAVTSSAEFAVPENDTEYAWSAVVVENNVGPYLQTNYYAGRNELGSPWNDSSYVIWYYDEVALAAYDVMGLSGVIPRETRPGARYEFPMIFDASNISSWENAEVIAMVINKKTGFIENATKIKVDEMTDVAEIDANDKCIALEDGHITLVSGDHAVVYSISGTVMANLSNGEAIQLPEGLYVVLVDGNPHKFIIQ